MPASFRNFSATSPATARPARNSRPPLPLPRRERTLIVLTALNLVLLAWSFGGVDAWSQGCAAVLSAFALFIALRSRRNPTGLSPAARLARFPIFWAGIAVAAYVLIQQCNPAYEYQRDGLDWWLEPRAHVAWLPAGMAVPWMDAGPFRALLQWFAPWATVCALWIGLTRRTSVVALLNIIAINGFLLAAFGLVQLAAGKTAIYGVRGTDEAKIFASFVYHNHAAAYFNLVGTVAVALALHGFWRRMQSGATQHGPAILHFLFALTAFTAVVLSFSLSGTILLAAGGSILLVLSAGRFRPALTDAGVPWRGLVAGLALVAAIGGLAAASGNQAFRENLQNKLAGGAETSLRSRLLVDKCGIAMFRDRPWLGWGAGCFRYGFTKYQQEELEIAGPGLTRYYWEHAHNDWLEALIELGVAGAIPLVAMAGAAIGFLFRQRFWRLPFALWAVGGVALVAAHALIDFPFQNPAVLFTTACVLVLSARWAELENLAQEPAL